MQKKSCTKEHIGIFGGKYETEEHNWEIWKADGEYYRICSICLKKQILFSVKSSGGYTHEDWRAAK